MTQIRLPRKINAARGELDFVAQHKEDRTFVTALGRGLEILRCFSELAPEHTVGDIAGMTGLPQPTAWRLCHTMKCLGYLVTVKGTDRLTVGTPILALGHAALPSTSFDDAVRPHLARMAQRFRAAVGLADYDRTYMLYVLSARSRPRLSITTLRVGTRVPLERTAIGWAYAAALKGEIREQILSEVRLRAGANWGETERHLVSAEQQLQEHGFVQASGLLAINLNAVAVPVRLQSGKVLAMNCSAPSSILPRSRILEEVGPALVQLAETVRGLITERADPIDIKTLQA